MPMGSNDHTRVVTLICLGMLSWKDFILGRRFRLAKKMFKWFTKVLDAASPYQLVVDHMITVRIETATGVEIP